MAPKENIAESRRLYNHLDPVLNLQNLLKPKESPKPCVDSSNQGIA